MGMRKIEIIVGVFVLAGILALAFLAIQVSGLTSEIQTGKTYKLYADFNNASGLNVRAKVTIAGVVVGRVTKIDLDPKNIEAHVEMSIDKKVDYISDDSIAAIKTAGVLGEKYVSISVGGSPDILHNGDEIHDTQSALVLEDLIGRLVSSFANKK